jgi:hypothetical protein
MIFRCSASRHEELLVEKMNLEERVMVTRAIINILDSWGVSAAHQVALLALPKGTRPGAIRQFRQSTPFPEDAGLMERIEHLVGIADALRTSYPHNAHMGSIWMNKVNHRFDNRTPLAAMLEDGLNGIMAVRMHLDCAYDWHISGSASQVK